MEKSRNIVVEFLKEVPVDKRPVELVERKGIGHPDSLCDGIAESVSRALCREYVNRFGRVMHHNTDQVELVGGSADPKFGGGEITRPMYILLSGRATTYVDNEKIPIGDIAITAAREYLRGNIKNFKDSYADIEQKLGQGSADLQHIFKIGGIPKSNDTSFGVGFAPLSLTEKLVLETEKYINDGLGMKEIGEDVKVMGVRIDDKITLTIAAATISKYIDDIDSYKSVMEEMHGKIGDFVSKFTNKKIDININTGDDYEKESVYLTVMGTSAEQGDDGSVGRGNRANGLITPYRPMSMEATAGKNPINHVGKMYNLIAKEIAEDIAEAGADQAYVRIMSQIGKPIDQPLIASVQVIGDQKIKKKANEIADYWLGNVTKITDMCIEGKVTTF